MSRSPKKSLKSRKLKRAPRRRFLHHHVCPQCGSRELQRTPSWAVRSAKLMMCLDCRFIWHAK